ncbi:hypothetical protein LTR91_016249 [Friedmanniomyces endolithicus]|uniref:Uncharacterized protein n=1 Tax=Friedmanniomyces endolithicus TaxID=329885 RepID=A0AAN6FUP5_9PEZI|nr:hypothetical protein LTR35_001093 [Friedmanniomyces endolithicus]KAK0296661.1 hypothetical protein LTS00_004987 [Friedmanniomyces endolithicus]KAK0304040.1 hypothetical protein LTR01_007656 [Friedmanniomyces endolithicus]KAK0324809.1 hypothetical protein LTR82_004515 [Friedmanniomyces endolithicus]KAK0826823.1 hypothetical protein LTR73_006158 [Friedmanniomyces endolithicus]
MRATSMLSIIGLAFISTSMALPPVSITTTVSFLTELGSDPTGVHTHLTGPPLTGHQAVITETVTTTLYSFLTFTSHHTPVVTKTSTAGVHSNDSCTRHPSVYTKTPTLWKSLPPFTHHPLVTAKTPIASVSTNESRTGHLPVIAETPTTRFGLSPYTGHPPVTTKTSVTGVSSNSSLTGHPPVASKTSITSVSSNRPLTGYPPVMTRISTAGVSSNKTSTGHPQAITTPLLARPSLDARPTLSCEFADLLARHVEAETRDRVNDAPVPAMLPREPASTACTVKTLFGGQVPIITTICEHSTAPCTPCVGCNADQCVEKRDTTSLPITHSVTRAFPWPTELTAITTTVTALSIVGAESSHSMVGPSPFPTPSKAKRQIAIAMPTYPDTKTMLPSTVLTFSTTGTKVITVPTAICNSTLHDDCIAVSGATEVKQVIWAVSIVALFMAAMAFV